MEFKVLDIRNYRTGKMPPPPSDRKKLDEYLDSLWEHPIDEPHRIDLVRGKKMTFEEIKKVIKDSYGESDDVKVAVLGRDRYHHYEFSIEQFIRMGRFVIQVKLDSSSTEILFGLVVPRYLRRIYNK